MVDTDVAYISKEDASKIDVKRVIETQIMDIGTTKKISKLTWDDMYNIDELFDVTYDNDLHRLVVFHYENFGSDEHVSEEEYNDYNEDNEPIDDLWYDWYSADAWFITLDENGNPIALESDNVDSNFNGVGEVSAGYVYRNCLQKEMYVVYY